MASCKIAELQGRYYPHFTEVKTRPGEVNSPMGIQHVSTGRALSSGPTPDPSLPFTYRTSGRPTTLSPSPRLVPTLTSRDCPGSCWRLCVEHDVIVLRRGRQMDVRFSLMSAHWISQHTAFPFLPPWVLPPLLSNLQTQPDWPPLTCSSFWSRSAVQSRR